MRPPRAADPDGAAAPEAIAWLTKWTVSLTFALFATLAFSFPTGRLARGRGRRLAVLVLALVWGVVIVLGLLAGV